MNGMLSHVEELLEAKKIFERNRTPLRIRALGIVLYHLGLSLRNCSMVLTSLYSCKSWECEALVSSIISIVHCEENSIGKSLQWMKLRLKSIFIAWVGHWSAQTPQKLHLVISVIFGRLSSKINTLF